MSIIIALGCPLNAHFKMVYEPVLGRFLGTHVDASHFTHNQPADRICSLLSVARIVIALLCAINRYAECCSPEKGIESRMPLATL